MDQFDRNDEQGPGWLGVLLISLFVSCAVVAAFHWASVNGRLPPALTAQAPVQGPVQAPAAAPQVPASIKVPRLTGLPMAVASELLSARGLRVVVTERRVDDQAAEGTVITQDPLSDSVLPEDSPVNVIVSAGASPNIAVPDVAGQTVEQAKAALEGAGLALAPLAESDPKDGIVDRTEPPAAKTTKRGSKVKLVLKLSTVEVPKVVGMYFGKAKTVLEAAGLTVGKVREGTDDYAEPGIIIRQAPTAGAQVARKSGVNLVRND